MIESNIFGGRLCSEASGILITDCVGGFFYYCPKSFSKYQGYFFADGQNIYKTIESLETDGESVQRVLYRANGFDVIHKEGVEKYYFLKGKQAFLYINETARPIVFNFDSRAAYDMGAWGRFYDIFAEEEVILVKYHKQKDSREPWSTQEYELWTAIVADSPVYQLFGRWKDVNYKFDAARADNPIRGVYEALALRAKKVAIASALKKEDAIKMAKEMFTAEEKSFGGGFDEQRWKDVPEKNARAATVFSAHALRSLVVKLQGMARIYAGLPWFFQFWTRDSALSSKAFSLIGDEIFAKELLLSLLKSLREDGLIPSRIPLTPLASVDSIGIVLFRLFELLRVDFSKRKIFSEEEIQFIYHSTIIALESIMQHHGRDGFIVAKPLESWMDTNIRSGACVELQALLLAMYDLLRFLAEKCHDEAHERYAQSSSALVLERVRKLYLKDGILADGLDDFTIRPNIFLAYYFYPELFSRDEWENIFDKMLPSLWLSWGGLASVDIKDIRFTSNHTGVDNKSYHNGDSWFFLNNLAALCMHRVNKDKYSSYINAILKASTQEILQSGIFGYHAELSSASQLESNGCLAQAWSSAFYIELIEEVFGKKG